MSDWGPIEVNGVKFCMEEKDKKVMRLSDVIKCISRVIEGRGDVDIRGCTIEFADGKSAKFSPGRSFLLTRKFDS